MAGCGCGVVKASGDPNGRSISNLGGLKIPVSHVCVTVKRGKKDRVVCYKGATKKAKKVLRAVGGVDKFVASASASARRVKSKNAPKRGRRKKARR